MNKPSATPTPAPALPIVGNADAPRRPSADVRSWTVTGTPTRGRNLAESEGATSDTGMDYPPGGSEQEARGLKEPPSHLSNFVYDAASKSFVKEGEEAAPVEATPDSTQAPPPTVETRPGAPTAENPPAVADALAPPDDAAMRTGDEEVDWESAISALPPALQEKARRELADYRSKVEEYRSFEGTIQRIKGEFGLSGDADVQARELQTLYDQRMADARDEIDAELADEFDPDRKKRLSEQLIQAAHLRISGELAQEQATAQWFTQQRVAEDAALKAARTKYPLLSVERNVGGVNASILSQTVTEYRGLMDRYILRAQTAQQAGQVFNEQPPSLDAMLTARGEWLNSVAAQERQKAEADKQKAMDEYHAKLAAQQTLPPTVASSAGRGGVEVPPPPTNTAPSNFPGWTADKILRLGR